MLKIKIMLSLLVLVSFSSCIKNETEVVQEEYFFSLKNYFESEAQRLTNQHSVIKKEVKRNATSEEKEIEIEDWKKEFGLFIESDINKISWKDSYQEINHQDTLIYQSKDPELRTQEIVIIKENEKIKEISIKNVVKNYLYNSLENLVYFPDSLYQVNKTQDVIVLGANKYEISGRFK